MKKIIPLVIVILAIVTGCQIVSNIRHNSSGPAKPIATSAPAAVDKTQAPDDKVTPVKVQVLDGQEFAAVVNTVGTAKAKEDYTLSAKTSGEITYLNTVIGARVYKGSVLGEIDKEMSEAQLKQAQANYTLAYNSYARQKSLAAESLIAPQQLETAETQAKVAESTLKLAKINYQNAKVISPINGEIAEVFSDVHEFTGAGKNLIRVINNDIIEFDIGLSEENSVKIKKGNQVFVSVAAYPDKSFTANITEIGTQANDSKTFPVKLSLYNKGQLLKGGMIANLAILLNTYKDAIVIPFYLAQKSSDGYYVFLEKDGVAVRQDISLGEIQGDKVRVISGLQKGDHLIVEGYKYVSDQTKVAVTQ